MMKKSRIPKEVAAFFSKAGKTSSANMTSEQRKIRAKNAAKARWDKKNAEAEKK